MFFDVRYMSAASNAESVFNPTDMHNAGWHTGFLFFMYGIKYQGKIFSEEVIKVFESCHTDAWNSCVTWQKCLTEQFNPTNCKVCSQVSTGVCGYLYSFCKHISEVNNVPQWMQPMKTIMGFSEGIGITYRNAFVNGFVEGVVVKVEELKIPTHVFEDVCSEFQGPLGCTRIIMSSYTDPRKSKIAHEVKQSHTLVNSNYGFYREVMESPPMIAQSKFVNSHKTNIYCASSREHLQRMANCMEASTRANLQRSYHRVNLDLSKVSQDLHDAQRNSGHETTIGRMKRQINDQDEVIKRHT